MGNSTFVRAETHVAEFKAFIEAPPTISELVYVHYYPGRTNAYPPVYTLARWQSSNGFFRAIANSVDEFAELPSTNLSWRTDIACASAEAWWTLKSARREIMIWTPAEVPFPADKSLQSSVDASRRDLSSFLNMGIQHAEIGAIRWDGDMFQYTNTIGAATWILSGALASDDIGRASNLDLVLVVTEPNFTVPRRFHWKIDYAYETSVGATYLPDRITTWSVNGDQRRLLDEYRVLKLEVSKVPLPSAAFAPSEFIQPAWNVYYVSNKTVGYFADGKWQPRMKPDDPRIFDPDRERRVRGYYWVVAIILFAPLWIVWRRGVAASKKH